MTEHFEPRTAGEIIASIDAQAERGRIRLGNLQGVCGVVARFCLNNSGISLSSSDALLLVRAALAGLNQQEQRLATLLSNLDASIKMSDPGAPHHILLLQVRELAEIVRLTQQLKQEG